MKNISFLFVILIFFSGCVFFRPSSTKLYKRAIKNQPFDAIIVPGCPFDGNTWSTAMKGRVLWATYLVKKGVAKNIIFSGNACYSPYVEAKIMSLYAQALGISPEHIFIEDKAEHSTENVYYSYQLAKKLGFKKLAVASDPFQSKMLMGFSNRRFKLPIKQIPFIVDTLKTIDDLNPTIDPHSSKVENFKSIIETQSKWHRFKGTSGLNIKFEKEN